MKAKEYFLKLIASGKTKEALDQIGGLSSINEKLQKAIVLLSAQYSDLKNKETEGIISHENAILERNKINYGLSSIVNKLPDELDFDVSDSQRNKLIFRKFILQNYKLLLIGIWVFFLLFLITLFILPKSGVDVYMDLKVGRCQFQVLDKTELDVNNEYENVQFTSFEEINVPALELIENLNYNDSKSYNVLGGISTIAAVNIGENRVSFSDFQFENLFIEKEAHVILDMHQDLKEEELMSISVNSGKASGEIVLQDSLHFECSNCIINNLEDSNPSKEFDFISGTFTGPQDQALLVSFSGNENIFSLDFVKDAESLSFFTQKKNLRIVDLQLVIPAGKGTALSSIQAGAFHFLDSKDRHYSGTNLSEGQYLIPSGYTELTLTKLVAEKKSLKMSLKGRVDNILLGNKEADYKPQNPSYLIWLVHCKLLWFLVLMVLPLLLSLGLYLFCRGK